MNERLALLIGLFVLFALVVALARALARDGYGVRPPPRRLGEARTSLSMPHDEPEVRRWAV